MALSKRRRSAHVLLPHDNERMKAVTTVAIEIAFRKNTAFPNNQHDLFAASNKQLHKLTYRFLNTDHPPTT